jgi:hypothetical protein
MIADILGVAQGLAGLRETLRGARREKRDRLADYLQQIAKCLDEAQADLRGGGHALRACAKMHQYVDLIPATVDDVLGHERAELLREGLGDALMVRTMNTPSLDEFDQLEEAAGIFEALSEHLRATA